MGLTCSVAKNFTYVKILLLNKRPYDLLTWSFFAVQAAMQGGPVSPLVREPVKG